MCIKSARTKNHKRSTKTEQEHGNMEDKDTRQKAGDAYTPKSLVLLPLHLAVSNSKSLLHSLRLFAGALPLLSTNSFHRGSSTRRLIGIVKVTLAYENPS